MKNTLFRLYLLVSMFCLCQILHAQTRQADSLALVMLHDSTAGATWSITWDLTQPMDQWWGIHLDSTGRVKTVNLTARGLAGNLPDLNLTALETINLSNNQLTGTVPDFSNLPQLCCLATS